MSVQSMRKCQRYKQHLVVNRHGILCCKTPKLKMSWETVCTEIYCILENIASYS